MALVRNLARLGRGLSSKKDLQLKVSAVSFSTTNTKNVQFPGAKAPFTTDPKITMPEEIAPIKIYKVMAPSGEVIIPSEDPKFDEKTISKMFRSMVWLSILDKILYESQRQGRISFYMTNFGEEASHIGSAAALEMEDLIYGQYREAGVLVWRGFTLEQFVDQCYGNCDDEGKGRQMPVHYGSKELNFMTISSPLATQIPQAAGAAYAFKQTPDNKRIVLVYFGEGAASEGDTHAAFNFAATLGCPVIFFCRNNGFAISTASTEQYKGDGIAGRAAGYGMATIRVDGTDLFAVYNATKMAKEYALKHNKPIILEAMQYRIGHHSTSDDSTAYRSNDELEIWNTIEHPISKLKNYMKTRGFWNEEKENEYVKDVRKQVLAQINLSEKKLKPDWREMFKDVYAEMPEHLKEQMKEMEAHVQAHKEHYPVDNFEKKN